MFDFVALLFFSDTAESVFWLVCKSTTKSRWTHAFRLRQGVGAAFRSRSLGRNEVFTEIYESTGGQVAFGEWSLDGDGQCSGFTMPLLRVIQSSSRGETQKFGGQIKVKILRRIKQKTKRLSVRRKLELCLTVNTDSETYETIPEEESCVAESGTQNMSDED